MELHYFTPTLRLLYAYYPRFQPVFDEYWTNGIALRKAAGNNQGPTLDTIRRAFMDGESNGLVVAEHYRGDIRR